MGRYLIGKTGDIAAVLRHRCHTNPDYSKRYARITDQELRDFLNER